MQINILSLVMQTWWNTIVIFNWCFIEFQSHPSDPMGCLGWLITSWIINELEDINAKKGLKHFKCQIFFCGNFTLTHLYDTKSPCFRSPQIRTKSWNLRYVYETITSLQVTLTEITLKLQQNYFCNKMDKAQG